MAESGAKLWAFEGFASHKRSTVNNIFAHKVPQYQYLDNDGPGVNHSLIVD